MRSRVAAPPDGVKGSHLAAATDLAGAAHGRSAVSTPLREGAHGGNRPFPP
jgi:hypothetical protein